MPAAMPGVAMPADAACTVRKGGRPYRFANSLLLGLSVHPASPACPWFPSRSWATLRPCCPLLPLFPAAALRPDAGGAAVVPDLRWLDSRMPIDVQARRAAKAVERALPCPLRRITDLVLGAKWGARIPVTVATR